MDSNLAAGVASMDEQARKDLMAWMEAENSKSKFQMSIHGFTDMCFKRCIDNVKTANLDGNEQQCLKACLTRFLNTNTQVVKE